MSIRIYVGVIILGANTLYIIFCLFKEIPLASKGLKQGDSTILTRIVQTYYKPLLQRGGCPLHAPSLPQVLTLSHPTSMNPWLHMYTACEPASRLS